MEHPLIVGRNDSRAVLFCLRGISAGAPVYALLFFMELSVGGKTKFPSVSERFDTRGSAGQSASLL
jgi:hypothetical protein